VRFARLWIVAPRGVRPDAAQLVRESGLLASGLRQIERLERLVRGRHDLLADDGLAPTDGKEPRA
jgi:hypothetical protein